MKLLRFTSFFFISLLELLWVFLCRFTFNISSIRLKAEEDAAAERQVWWTFYFLPAQNVLLNIYRNPVGTKRAKSENREEKWARAVIGECECSAGIYFLMLNISGCSGDWYKAAGQLSEADLLLCSSTLHTGMFSGLLPFFFKWRKKTVWRFQVVKQADKPRPGDVFGLCLPQCVSLWSCWQQ